MPALSLIGMKNAAKTPAMVAWTPLFNTLNQRIKVNSKNIDFLFTFKRFRINKIIKQINEIPSEVADSSVV